MLNNESVDRSYETAKNVVRDESRDFTTDGNIRSLALEILKLGYDHQFDDDRGEIRRILDQLITQVTSEETNQNEI
jgi:hypothetical protein